MLLSKGMV